MKKQIQLVKETMRLKFKKVIDKQVLTPQETIAIFLEYLNYDSLQQVDNPIIVRKNNQDEAIITINAE